MMLWMCCASALAGQAEDLAAEGAPKQIVDQAEVLQPAQHQQLERYAEAWERDLGVELVVVTVTSVAEGRPLDLALALEQAWGLNQDVVRNDVLLLLVLDPEQPRQGRAELVLGAGLRRALPTDWESTFMLDYFYPELERGQGPAALIRWAHTVNARILDRPDEVRRGATVALPLPGPPEEAGWPLWSKLFFGLFVALGLGSAAYALLQRRFCFNHPVPEPMYTLPESEQRALLPKGGRVGDGVDFLRQEVLCCPVCAQKRVISRALPPML